MSDALGYNDLIGNDKNSSFEELLTKDDSQNTTYFTEIYRLSFPNKLYKIKNGLSPDFITEIFARKTESHYNLKQCNGFRIPSICTVYHGSESISFLGPKIWNILPDEFKAQISPNSFKKSVRNESHKISMQTQQSLY